MQVLIVVVRYKMPIELSPTLQSLFRIFQARPDLLQAMEVVLWDNTPEPLSLPPLPIPLLYRHAESNVGVSGAYNGALALAEEQGTPWLLLLDQDTELTEIYLSRMLDYSYTLQADETIATVVPFVLSGDSLVSPRRFGKLLRNFAIDRSTNGPYAQDAYAVNSGTLMRASALRGIGGYSNRYWLDLSDAYIFHVLHLDGKRMYIAGDLELQHAIASLNFDRDMSAARYANFLAAENSFADEFRPAWQNAFYTAWLLARTFRQLRRYRNKAFARLTFRSMLERLALRRSTRRKRWAAELHRRNLPAVHNGQHIA